MMAHTGSKPKSLSYGICYGFMGGHRHGRKLNVAMRQSGYRLKRTEEADIIIAHSGGCWLIPPDSRPKLILYVGMPLNTGQPARTLRQARLLMRKHGTRWSNTRRNLKSLHYAVLQPGRNLRLIRMAKTAKPVIVPGAAAIFIANRDDPWPRAGTLKDLMDTMPWAFISLPGSHDDVKEHPDPYVQIIDHYARLLA